MLFFEPTNEVFEVSKVGVAGHRQTRTSYCRAQTRQRYMTVVPENQRRIAIGVAWIRDEVANHIAICHRWITG
ncbi:MAG: hypothetical protein HQ481_18820 [Alphaproteobacteria bacterium]|nr:hypothetical protein [Alphaproteobacteria bacterium]